MSFLPPPRPGRPYRRGNTGTRCRGAPGGRARFAVLLRLPPGCENRPASRQAQSGDMRRGLPRRDRFRQENPPESVRRWKNRDAPQGFVPQGALRILPSGGRPAGRSRSDRCPLPRLPHGICFRCTERNPFESPGGPGRKPVRGLPPPAPGRRRHQGGLLRGSGVPRSDTPKDDPAGGA